MSSWAHDRHRFVYPVLLHLHHHRYLKWQMGNLLRPRAIGQLIMGWDGSDCNICHASLGMGVLAFGDECHLPAGGGGGELQQMLAELHEMLESGRMYKGKHGGNMDGWRLVPCRHGDYECYL